MMQSKGIIPATIGHFGLVWVCPLPSVLHCTMCQPAAMAANILHRDSSLFSKPAQLLTASARRRWKRFKSHHPLSPPADRSLHYHHMQLSRLSGCQCTMWGKLRDSPVIRWWITGWCEWVLPFQAMPPCSFHCAPGKQEYYWMGRYMR
uniref:Uncharacterized protein n=1 Tax=Micrurus spixii TaxID=129469 RepID=A0A2D4N0Y0_9SAUR